MIIQMNIVLPFVVRRILTYLILYLCSPPKLSRYGTAIEDSLEASSRSVLPALQAGGRCSDSQEMAGAVDVTARGAIEASEGAGGRGACDGSAMGEVVRGWGFRGSGETSVGQWGKAV